MLLLYNLGVRIYYFMVFLASFVNSKAELWISGRKRNRPLHLARSAWFHFASLGEYEQGLPVLAGFRSQHREIPVVITFFSPSGYEIRKNSPYADAVYYLPLDTPGNARRFIDTINPIIAVFTKYEYWYHYFHELNRANVPLFVISAIFRPGQVFFRRYGGLHRRMLGWVTHFFVQDDDSRSLLERIGIHCATVSGDTRFDRVAENAGNPRSFPIVDKFAGNARVLIGGSTWPEDERLLAALFSKHQDWRFIIVPHEIREEQMQDLAEMLPAGVAIRYSRLESQGAAALKDKNIRVLIIDNVGMLSSLYRYGTIAYVGGGFGAGIHNTLEPAAFGLPLVFGPNYQKFREARTLVSKKLAFSISSESELETAFTFLSAPPERREKMSAEIREFIRTHTGATAVIMHALGEALPAAG